MDEGEHGSAADPVGGLDEPFDGDPDSALPTAELEALRATLRVSEPSVHDDLWAQMLRKATDPATPDPGSLLVDGIDVSGGPFDLGEDDGRAAEDVAADGSDDTVTAARAPAADGPDGYDGTSGGDPYSDEAETDDPGQWPGARGDTPGDLDWRRDDADDQASGP